MAGLVITRLKIDRNEEVPIRHRGRHGSRVPSAQVAGQIPISARSCRNTGQYATAYRLTSSGKERIGVVSIKYMRSGCKFAGRFVTMSMIIRLIP